MFDITLKRSFAALAVMVGLLAVAGPASAQGGGTDFTRLVDKPPAVTMLDYGGTPVVTYSVRDSSQPSWAWHEAARTGIALSPQGPSISLAFDVPAEYADTQQGEVPPTHRGSAITMLDYTGSP